MEAKSQILGMESPCYSITHRLSNDTADKKRVGGFVLSGSREETLEKGRPNLHLVYTCFLRGRVRTRT